MNRALKLLMNKINDLRGNKKSHSVLSGISDGSLRYRNAAHNSTPGLQNERIKRVYINDSQGTLEENDSPDFNYPRKHGGSPAGSGGRGKV